MVIIFFELRGCSVRLSIPAIVRNPDQNAMVFVDLFPTGQAVLDNIQYLMHLGIPNRSIDILDIFSSIAWRKPFVNNAENPFVELIAGF